MNCYSKENITKNITENITKNITENITENIQENIKENNDDKKLIDTVIDKQLIDTVIDTDIYKVNKFVYSERASKWATSMDFPDDLPIY